MDAKFRMLLELEEKWARRGDDYSANLVAMELLTYGMERGFLKDGLPENPEDESDESVAGRALASSHLIREFLGEDPGSVLEMTREEQLALIERAGPVGEEIIAGSAAILGEEVPEKPAAKKLRLQ